jgi:hypothetical protein
MDPLDMLTRYRVPLLTAQKSASLHNLMLNLSALLKAFRIARSFPAKKQGPQFASNLRAHARPKPD